ncbi:tripartite tricarboxylate transporter substrate-binding protein [Bradyrhizobium tropiciagri]|uniref:tripartite tricarboxylate transporter substrate-binding protein n=1 Tax=Bradyrhizobium tropiciagri TaxID=312253 RepID=UPI003D317598
MCYQGPICSVVPDQQMQRVAISSTAPSGYVSAYVINPGLYPRSGTIPTRTMRPSELGTSPNVMLVDPQLVINSIADLVARAKASPDELNHASPGQGTTPYLARVLTSPGRYLCSTRAQVQPSR